MSAVPIRIKLYVISSKLNVLLRRCAQREQSICDENHNNGADVISIDRSRTAPCTSEICFFVTLSVAH